MEELDEVHVVVAYEGEQRDPQQRKRYRFFAMFKAVEKLLERLVGSRISGLIATHYRDTFWGFRKGMGAEEEVNFLRRLQERFHKSSWFALMCAALDIYKAFGRMLRSAITESLRIFGIGPG